jgi:hypothetical protein
MSMAFGHLETRLAAETPDPGPVEDCYATLKIALGRVGALSPIHHPDLRSFSS